MPFDPQTKTVVGADARRAKTWAIRTFCAWLESELNAEPYASDLGLTDERKAIVTNNREIAGALYSDEQSPPVVIVRDGPVVTSVNGRRMMTLLLDMGVRDMAPDDDNAIDEAEADSMLVDFVFDAIESNYQTLADLGLNNTDLQADAERQRAGSERNPHTLTFFVCVQKD